MPFTGDFRDDQRRFQQQAPAPQIGMPRSPQGRVGVQAQPPSTADELNAFYDRLGVGAGTTQRGISMAAPPSPPHPQAPAAQPKAAPAANPWAGYQMSPAVQRYADMGGGDPVRGSLLDHLDYAMTHFGPGNPYGVGPGYASRIANGLRGYDAGPQAGDLQAAKAEHMRAEAASLRDPLQPYRDPYAAFLFGESKNPGSGAAMRQAALGEQARAAQASGQELPVNQGTLGAHLALPEYAPMAEVAALDDEGQPRLGLQEALARLRQIGVQGWDDPTSQAGQIARELLTSAHGNLGYDLNRKLDEQLPAEGWDFGWGTPFYGPNQQAIADRELLQRLFSSQ